MKWLPDVNVLLALAWAHHPHHHAAHTWFAKAAPDGWATTLLTQSGFLRLSMNPQIVHVAIDASTARSVLARLVMHPQHHFGSGSLPLTAVEFDPIALLVRGYRQMTDATLLFQARSTHLTLVSFDQSIRAIAPQPNWVEILHP